MLKIEDLKVIKNGEVVKTCESKSQLFKHLYDKEKLDVSKIAKITNNRYQFVYSVIDTHTNGNIRSTTKSKVSKSEQFRKMYDEGKTIGEIAKITNSNYTFVHTVIKKHRNK